MQITRVSCLLVTTNIACEGCWSVWVCLCVCVGGVLTAESICERTIVVVSSDTKDISAKVSNTSPLPSARSAANSFISNGTFLLSSPVLSLLSHPPSVSLCSSSKRSKNNGYGTRNLRRNLRASLLPGLLSAGSLDILL